MLKNAAERGLRVGCAPDTFMGAGLQTCRKLIDDGAIGTPVAATAFMMGHGPERWHPDPEFFYKVAGVRCLILARTI
jgi:predicted dehydrogenase